MQLLNDALAGGYDILREVGAGGMATVYLARDIRHDRHVAVTVLNRELGAVLGTERFLSAIRVTVNLHHPHRSLFDSGESAGLLYDVMPFIEGETLRGQLARECPRGCLRAVLLRGGYDGEGEAKHKEIYKSAHHKLCLTRKQRECGWTNLPG